MTVAETFNSFTTPVSIIATDLDTNVLATADKGVYAMDRVERLSPERLKRFLKGSGSQEGYAAVRPELRRMIQFQQLNLLNASYPVKGPLDVIFCRNVMIYFDKPTQYKILSRFAPMMQEDGLLFAGHSKASCTPPIFSAHWARPFMNSPVAHVERQRRSYVQPAPDHEYVEGFATNLYHDRNFDCQAAKILPGEYFVTTRDMLLVTVLGSCVAACIRDSENGIGGMNHFMLPGRRRQDVVSSSARYGTYAMEMLINHLLKSAPAAIGWRPKCSAAARAGKPVVEQRRRPQCRVRAEVPADRKIPVVAKDLLDSYPRKVYYFPNAGRVLVRKLHRVH